MDELSEWLFIDGVGEVGLVPPGAGWLALWTELTGRTRHVPGSESRRGDDRVARAARALAFSVERHLLLATLDANQRASVAHCGWFDLPWREQCLVLRVHTQQVPTVDAYQPERRPSPTRDRRPGTYLCSWDLRALPGATAGANDGGAGHDGQAAPAYEFRSSRTEPLTLARLVMEAWRRGAVRHLLEQALTVRVSRSDLERR